MHHGAAMLSARDASDLTPAAPSNPQASQVSDSQIDVAWTDNSFNEGNFQVQYDTDSEFGSPASVTATADSTSKSITGLSAETTYYFRIRAQNAEGNSDWTSTVSATTAASSDGGGGGGTTPDPPDAAPSDNSLSATSDTAATQTWTDNSTNEDSFVVQLSTVSDFSSDTTEATTAADATSYNWTGLSEGTTYYCRVKARNTDGDSNWSGTASDQTQLDAPSGLSWSGQGLGFVNLYWDDLSAKEAEYQVYKDGSLWNTLSANTTNTSTSVTGGYKVRAAHSSIPNSDFSNTVTITQSDLDDGGSSGPNSDGKTIQTE